MPHSLSIADPISGGIPLRLIGARRVIPFVRPIADPPRGPAVTIAPTGLRIPGLRHDIGPAGTFKLDRLFDRFLFTWEIRWPQLDFGRIGRTSAGHTVRRRRRGGARQSAVRSDTGHWVRSRGLHRWMAVKEIETAGNGETTTNQSGQERLPIHRLHISPAPVAGLATFLAALPF